MESKFCGREKLVSEDKRPFKSDHTSSPSTPAKYLERKNKAFTPTFKKIRWNKHSLNHRKITESPVEESINIRLKLHLKSRESIQVSEIIPKKQDLLREKSIKYSPARFINTNSIKKYTQIEKKFYLPSIESDMRLIKKYNQKSIYNEFYQEKVMQSYISGCREQNKSFYTERRVRFNIV
jgi:hypothetical protein